MSDKIKTTKEEREAKKALKLAQEKERMKICAYMKRNMKHFLIYVV